MTKTESSLELTDVYGHTVSIECPEPHKAFGGSVAAIHIYADDPWCPNALQLRALRDRCNVILAQHTKADPGPYRVVHIPGVDGEQIQIESGDNIPGAAKDVVIRIDLEGNEDGPEWIGDLDALAHLASAIDDVWDRYNPPPEMVVKALASFATATAANATEIQEALDSMRDGVVTDKAGGLYTLEGALIAMADDESGKIWLKRIAAIVNAVVEARGES